MRGLVVFIRVYTMWGGWESNVNFAHNYVIIYFDCLRATVFIIINSSAGRYQWLLIVKYAGKPLYYL